MGAILSWLSSLGGGSGGSNRLTNGTNGGTTNSGDNLGCERNTDECGRTAINGPTGSQYGGPWAGSAPEGHPEACRFQGEPNCGAGSCQDPSCFDEEGNRIVAADTKVVKIHRDQKYSGLEGAAYPGVFNFSGRSRPTKAVA